MSETEKFLEESGGDFLPIAKEILAATVESLNTMCGGKLSFGEPSLAAGDAWPEKPVAPLAFSVLEITGDIEGKTPMVVSVISAGALCKLMLGEEPASDAEPPADLTDDEKDAFGELCNAVGSSAGAALRALLDCAVSVAASAPEAAPGPEKLLETLGPECVVAAAEGSIADAETSILFAFSTDFCRAMVEAATPEEPEEPEEPDEQPGESLEPPEHIDRILKIPVPMIVILAEKNISFSDAVALSEGSVIEFEKSSAEPLDLLVNNHKIGQGKVLKVGEHFGLRIDEIGSPQKIVRQLG